MAKTKLVEIPKTFSSAAEKVAFLDTLRSDAEKASAKRQRLCKQRDDADELERSTRARLAQAFAVRVKAVKA